MTLESWQTGDHEPNQVAALEVASRYVDNYERAAREGWTLGLYGESRSGKTHLAVAIAQACATRYGAGIQLLNLPDALRITREQRGQSTATSPLEAAAKVELLIVDDLGAEHRPCRRETVSWMEERLYLMFEHRHMSRLPTIWTSNLTPAQLDQHLSSPAGVRILGRLRGPEVAALELTKLPDLHQAAKAEAAALLGL